MGEIHVSTKYDHKPTSNVCTNRKCKAGLPHYKGIGKKTRTKCHACGKYLRRIQGEPSGTSHPW